MNNYKLLAALFGFPMLTAHAAQRIRERFGATDDGDALIWAIGQMRQVERLTCRLRPKDDDWSVVWHCPGGVRLVRIGDVIVTAYREGEPDSEEVAA